METIGTTVYRKVTNKDIYIKWKSFAPNSWKRRTLKTSVRRAYDVSSLEYYLGCELNTEIKFSTNRMIIQFG